MIVKEETPVQQYLVRQKEIVDTHLGKFLPPAHAHPQVIHEAMRYSMFAGGKRIRPILTLATGEALHGPFNALIYLACALEMIHTYSLVHDDLPAMDNDDYRRGKPSLHRSFGEDLAILAGDALLTRAFQLLAEIPAGQASAEAKLTVIHRICRAIGTCRGMLAGQVVDLTTQNKAFSRKKLESLHSAKTGALIHACVYCGALLSNAPEEQRRKLSVFGSNIGLAFQIMDDILDVEGSLQELGKTTGKDKIKGKATYASLYGVETSRRIAHDLLERALDEIEFLGGRGQKLRDLAGFICSRRS
ncbi:MAG: polyprenyl synthetase family protein [Acidobacteriota bacterium]